MFMPYLAKKTEFGGPFPVTPETELLALRLFGSAGTVFRFTI
jgi:hypothetical protein